ncbi:MAG: glycosyltransferase family 39 protein, partial [Chloroflexota bacterium]
MAAFLRFYRLDALPLGFHHDEALDAISAAGIWRGDHPIFFTNTNPREPLMIYLQSLGILAFGPTRLGARSMQAAVGTAGVLAAWFLVKELAGRRVALLAAGFMAVSFWQMFESRISARAISEPLVGTLCFLFFWRTLAERRRRDTLLAGLFLGLSLYTYTNARAIPIFLVLMVAWQLCFSPRFFRETWRHMLAAAGTGVVAFLPLGVYFLRHPNQFWGRSLQVNVVNPQAYTGSSHAGGVETAVLHTLGMFSFRGDTVWKYNLSGLPVFDWPVSILFYGGLLLALAGTVAYVRQPRSARPTVSLYPFLLLWMVAMLVPGFLSSESPHFLRTIGVIPAVFVFPALAVDWLGRRWRFALPLAGVLIAAEGVETYQHYFGQWAHSTAAYYAQQGNIADVARWLARLPAGDREPILFSTEYPGHPTILYLAPGAFGRIRWFNGQQSLPFPPAGRNALYVFPSGYTPRFARLSQFFSAGQLVAQGRDPAGGVAYRIYQSDHPPAQDRPLQPLAATIGGLVHFDGTAIAGQIAAGQSLPVLEYWHSLKAGPQGLRAFVHLVDSRGHQWAQADSLGFYAEDWRPGDATVNAHFLTVPPDAPPIPMKLLFGFYMPDTGKQLSVTDASGRPVGTQLALGTVRVLRGKPLPAPRSLPHPMARSVSPGLTLAGYALPARTVDAGGTLHVTLYWRVEQPL